MFRASPTARPALPLPQARVYVPPYPLPPSPPSCVRTRSKVLTLLL